MGGLGFETGEGEEDADLFTDGGEGFHLFTGEEMRLAHLDVDDTYDLVAGDDGGREEGFVLVFRELCEVFEAGVKIGFFAYGDEAALASYPASEAFIHSQAE